MESGTEQQLIDADGEFTGSLSVPADVASRTSYGVVAVIGCQSGGKSTLLNAAFGTHFPVLDATSRGRRRTTLGAWGAVCVGGPVPLVVLDMEGADSRERGDGARAFESRVALLSLALSDVVVANMWAHDVGRHSAANYDLFETVFAHIARLRERRRVRLLLAIRDYDGHADLTVIRRVLRDDLTAIWKRLRAARGASFDERFELAFVALPHLKYAPDSFATSVRELRDAVDSIVAVSATERAPLAAFDALAAAVWVDVLGATGGDGDDAAFTLDVPKHAALASHYQLGRLLRRLVDARVTPAVEGVREAVEADWRVPLENYTVRVREIAEGALAEFDSLAAPLVEATDGGAEAAAARRRELGVQLVEAIGGARERFLWTCRDSSMTAFEDEFRPLLGSASGFQRQARRMANKHIAAYRQLLEQARYPDVLAAFLEREDTLVTPVDGFGSDPPSDDALQLAREQHDEERDRAQREGPLLVEEQPAPVDARTAAIMALDEDSEDEGDDEYALEKFMKDVHQLVEERRRMGELMLPGNVAGPTQPPWWKGLLMRGAILLINYLQARQGHLASVKAQRQHEQEFPPVPTF